MLLACSTTQHCRCWWQTGRRMHRCPACRNSWQQLAIPACSVGCNHDQQFLIALSAGMPPTAIREAGLPHALLSSQAEAHELFDAVDVERRGALTQAELAAGLIDWKAFQVGGLMGRCLSGRRGSVLCLLQWSGLPGRGGKRCCQGPKAVLLPSAFDLTARSPCLAPTLCCAARAGHLQRPLAGLCPPRVCRAGCWGAGGAGCFRHRRRFWQPPDAVRSRCGSAPSPAGGHRRHSGSISAGSHGSQR